MLSLALIAAAAGALIWTWTLRNRIRDLEEDLRELLLIHTDLGLHEKHIREEMWEELLRQHPELHEADLPLPGDPPPPPPPDDAARRAASDALGAELRAFGEHRLLRRIRGEILYQLTERRNPVKALALFREWRAELESRPAAPPGDGDQDQDGSAPGLPAGRDPHQSPLK
jgi:hypothetical protein